MDQTPRSDCANSASSCRNCASTLYATTGTLLGDFQSALPGQSSPSSLSVSRTMRFASFLIVLLSALFPAVSHASSIGMTFNGALTTFRGNLHQPYGVATDSNGNVYIDNSLDGVLLKETPNSDGTYTESVVASGLGYSFAVAVDGQGDLFTINNICGNANCNTILEFKPNGNQYVQSTISTSPYNNPYGIAVDTSGNNVYVADSNNSRVVKITNSGGNWTETVLSTSIIQPQGIAVDANGNVYVAPMGGYIVMFSPSGGSYTQTNLVQPSGVSQMAGILLDAAGDIYISDTVGNKVVKLVPVGGGDYSQTPYIGNGLNGPWAMAFGPNGSMFVVDNGNNRVAQFSTSAVNFGSVPVGTTSNTTTLLYTISNSVFIGGINYLTEGATGLDFADAGSDTCQVSMPAVGIQPQAPPSTYTCVVNVTFTPKYPGQRLGAVLFQDALSRVLNTTYISGVGVGPQAVIYPGTQSSLATSLATGLNTPFGVAADAAGNVYIADSVNNRVLRIPPSDPACATASDCILMAKNISGGLSSPRSVAVDGVGNVYISDFNSNRVLRVPTGDPTCVTSNNCLSVASNMSLSNPIGVAVDGAGNVYIADYGNNRVLMAPVTDLTCATTSHCVSVASNGGLNYAFGVAVDSKKNVYIADGSQNRVIFVPSTDLTCASSDCTAVGTGLQNPLGVALDGAGNVYIADSQHNRVLYVPSTDLGCALSDCIALATNLNGPWSVAVGGNGTLYIADSYNNRALAVDVTDATALTYPTLTNVGTLDSTDNPLSVTLLNIGNQPLSIASGTNPAYPVGFISDSNTTCSLLSTLANSASCIYGVDFLPNAAGTTSGSVILTDNNLNVAGATQTIATLSGNAIVPLTAFTITGYPTTTPAGPTFSYTVTAYNNTNIATAYTGTVTFTTSDASGGFLSNTYTFVAGDNGVHTFTTNAYFHTAGNQTITVTDQSAVVAQTSNNILVTANVPARISATGGTGQQAVIGAAFTNPLGVRITDNYGNPVSGITVNYAPPSTGASATMSPAASVVTANDGTASLSATANATAGQYSVVASSLSLRSTGGGTIAPQGASSPSVNFSLTNLQATPTVTITSPTASTITYGQASTAVSATVRYTTGTPTGTVTFNNSGTPLGADSTLNAGSATFPTLYYTPGTYQFGAVYNGDTNYNIASASTVTMNVNKASTSMTGPSQSPYLVVYQTTGAIPITVAGQYSGAGISAPTGQVTCGIYSSGNLIASYAPTISSGAVSVPVANTFAPGLYSVVCNYGGDSNYTAATQLTVSLQVGQIQPTISWTQPSNSVYGTTLGSILGAVALDGQNAVTGGGTYAYTATLSGGSPVAVTASTVLPAGSYTLNVLFTPTNSQTYKTASGSVTLVVTQAGASIALVSSSNPSLTTTSVTLTATVSSSSTTPTGTVTFFNGSTALGAAVSLVNGVATLPITTLPIGTDSISAIYNGDNNFTGSTSNRVSQVIEDFSLAISTTSGSVTAVSVVPGGTATYTLIVSPVAPATVFPSIVNLTVTGLPVGATYTLSQNSIPAGSGSVTLTLTVTTSIVPPASSMNGGAPQIRDIGRGFAPLSLALLLLPFATKMRRAGKRMARIVSVLVLLAAGIAATAGLSGCGATTGFFGQASKTYTISITGTSGPLVHSTTVTLTIE